MQQAAARVLKMVSTNPTRPEVVARQTGLKLQEVQQIVDSIQGFTTTDMQVSSMQSDVSEAIRLIANNPKRPEVVARQTGLKVQDVQQLVSRFSNEALSKSGGVTDRQISKWVPLVTTSAGSLVGTCHESDCTSRVEGDGNHYF